MKLGKYVAAVMPVARSQICTAGVFQVTCGTDMTIQVDGKYKFLPLLNPGPNWTVQSAVSMDH